MNESIVAAIRFGFGPGPANSVPAGDARGWLKGQLGRRPAPAAFAGLADAASGVTALFELRKQRQQMKADGDVDKDAFKAARQAAQQAYLREAAARYAAAVDSRTPFIERLVAFWSNHFTVSGTRPEVRPLAGAFEREAIRPHVTGRFEELVLAVVRHPVMGLYLDNALSVGPESMVGRRRHRGVNENLGRELMELHTLGVDGGYTEEDVRALARILTGWSISRLNDPEPGRFRFYPALHEPGAQTLLGRRYDQDGMAQGLAAIRDISRHPSTARHIARQLAAHFIADRPPPQAVERLAATFEKSGGDLHAVSAALVDLPESWSSFQEKVKAPWDMVVSASVATGIRLPPEQVAPTLARLGQPVWMAEQPSGWPDDAASWIGPEAVLRRVQWCANFAAHAEPNVDPVALADGALGDALAPEARTAIARAESRPTALAMLLASPAFQRR